MNGMWPWMTAAFIAFTRKRHRRVGLCRGSMTNSMRRLKLPPLQPIKNYGKASFAGMNLFRIYQL